LSAIPLRAQQYWVPIETPTGKDLNALSFIDSARGWIAGDEGIILKTENGGERWTMQQNVLTTNVINIQFLNARLGWALSIKYPSDSNMWFGTYLLKTTTGGNEWQSQIFDSVFYTTLFFQDSLHGWLGGSRGIIVRTTNSGGSWSDVDDSAAHRFDISRIHFFTPGYGFALGGNMDIAGIIWRTSDRGAKWFSRFVCAEPLNGIHFFDSLHILCVGGDADFGSGKVETYDGGEHWQYTYLGIWGNARALSFRNDKEGWSPLGFSGTLMYTLDSGKSWMDVFSPDTIPMYDVVFTDGRNGYMCGAYGRVLKYIGKTNNVPSDYEEQFPDKVILKQNYPNPFNPQTTINFLLHAAGKVTLKVYDVSGREVATLIDNKFLQAGSHTIYFDGSTLMSGIYFYRLTVNGNTVTKKLILLK
jgi:photosystem II stability/assembly factor-like uncharacterized protein